MSMFIGALATKRFGRKAFAAWIAYEVGGAVLFYSGAGALLWTWMGQ